MSDAPVTALLRDLDERGVRLSTDGERLTVDAPRGALTPDLRIALVTHKPALIRHLGSPGPGLGPIDRSHQIHASFAQQRLWFLDRLDPGGGYNIPVAFELDGALDVTALHQAIQRIMARHEALRTHFADPVGDDKEPYQIVEPHAPLVLATIDLRAHPDVPQRVAEITRALAWSPFDLAAGPLLRVKVLRLGDSHHLLCLSVHHIVFDGLSLAIFLRELAIAYNALLTGTEPELPALSVQYPDFAVWQRRMLAGETLDRLVTYWREHLSGAPPLLDLPTDRPRPALQSFAGGRVRRVLDGDLAAAIDALARQQRVTSNMTLLAAFAALLARYARADDLVIGTPVAGRNLAPLEGLIGFFANTLAVRLRPAPGRPFVEFLSEVKQVMSGALAHQALPFERVVEAMNVERSLDRNPLFQAMFSFQDDHINDFALSGLQATLVEFEHEASTFDLTLNLRRHSDHLLAIFEYSADLFDLSTIERLAENFQALLMGIVGDPQAPLQALPLTAPGQLARVLLDFNRTELAGDPGPPVHAIFQRQVAARPDAIAITDGDRTITYAVLNSRANRLARQLVELGVGPGILVAVCLPRSIETVVAVLATLKAGGAYVPLDPEQPERRLQNMLDDSRAPILLTTDELRSRLPDDASRRVLCLDGLDSRQIERFSDADLESRSGLDDLAYVVYTSGSTGTPKGVMIAHRAVLNTHHGCRIGYRLGEIGEGMSYLQMANPAFDVFTGDWVRALCNGGRLVLCPIGLLAAPDELHRRMVAENIGFAEFVPAVVRRLCDLLEATGQRLDFMHVCVVGSDVFHVRDYRRLRALCRPDAQVTNSYGLTEAAIDSTFADHVDGALIGDAIAPIGRPMVNVRTYILDEALQPVPLGVRGELCVAGLGLADGYFRRPELTAEKFVEIELVGRRERIYRTGDLARWRPSGDLEFLGRLDHQVQLRGLRIELGEIEAAMLEHPSVREAVVMLGSDSTDPMLVAWLVLSAPLTDVALALREFLASRVPRYMVPSTFVVLPALPVTPNGKVDRRALPEPDNARRDRFVEPRDGVELKLVLIWEELIGRAPIGVHDDFFALGGDSLLSVRLVSVLERTFGVRVPLHVLFQCGTIERLASVLRRESVQTPWSPLVCLQPAGKRAPFFFIHAAGGIVFRYTQVAALLGDQRPFYGIQARGIEPGDPPYPSIEVMAADYVRAIVEIQPKGPYLLGGWSFGGTVAYAMAQLLVARGESVPMLVMVDAPSPYVDDYEEDDVEFLLERLRPAAGLELADLHVHDTKEAKLRYLFEQQRLAELFAPDIDIADAALRLGIHKHHNKIICEYRPTGPCPTKIVFFQPSESITFDKRMRNPVPAWRELAQGGMEVHTAPGNHFNMFSADNGPVLAELLRACVVGLP